MPGVFEGCGVRFLYPDNWTVSEHQDDATASTMTLEGPDAVFFSVSRHPQGAGSQAVAEAVQAMRQEYPELEESVWSADDPVTGPLEGAELDFYCLDLAITSRLVALEEKSTSLLVQMQGENRAFDRCEPVFRAMIKSIRDGLAAEGSR
jgi:hypothetical protein